MPLFLKPHTATRWKAEDYVSATLSVGGVLYGDPVDVRGQLLPMSAQAAFDRTGEAQERPHEWLWDSAVDFTFGDIATIGERTFRVSSPQEVLDAEPITAHRRCVLSEIQESPVHESNPEV